MQSFPVKLPTLWRQVFPAGLLGALAGRGLVWLEGQPFSWPNTLPLMAVAAVTVLAIHFFQPNQAGPGGLNLMNSWGFRRRLAWADIQSASFARMYYLQPSIRLKDLAGRSHWVAIDTKNLNGLHALAMEHGGADHPLTRALETPLHKL